MKTWNAVVRREIRRCERKLLAACESFAVHGCQRRLAEECDQAARTLRLVFDALQAGLHGVVGITPPDQLDADKVDTATFSMDESIRGFRNTVVGAWTIRRLGTGPTDADRDTLFGGGARGFTDYPALQAAA